MQEAEPLNPAQQEVIDLLGAAPDERPSFDPNLRVELKAELEIALDHLASEIPDGETLWVAKRSLAQVMGCETRYMVELEADFEWSIPVARGTISHKAIELSVHWQGDTTPLAVVDETLASLEFDSSSLGQWLQGLSEADRAELRSEVGTRVTAFAECWPPLKAGWRPTFEMPVRVEVAQRRIVLSGKVDLTLGTAVGNTAGKVIVDLKTGRFSPVHRDDLRFYALVEAIRIGTPPRLVATYYLDEARFIPETVTVGLLEASAARVIDGVHRMVALRFAKREPTTQTGPGCRWCPNLTNCEPGTAFAQLDDELNDMPTSQDLSG